MKSTGWRNLCFLLGLVCIVQLWRDCQRSPAPAAAVADCPKPSSTQRAASSTIAGAHSAGTASPPASAPPAAPSGGISAYGFSIPSWAVWLAPHPGEDLRSYRDRMLPLARAVIAPHRARVARGRDSFAARVRLDGHQLAELDAAARETATALQDRVMNAVLSGEVAPASFKPMTGVTVARELLDIVGRGNRRFLDTLRDDQRAELARHPFDFADYLVFSTPWEDALSFLD
jgi:hypothetical protein